MSRRGPAVASSAKERQKNTDRCIMMKQKALSCLDKLSELVKEEAVAQPFSSAVATEVVVASNKLITNILEIRRRRELLAQERATHRAQERAIHRRFE